MIDKKNIMRKIRTKTVPISIRIPVSASKFMSDNKYSPTAIFIETLKQLGWKQS